MPSEHPTSPAPPDYGPQPQKPSTLREDVAYVAPMAAFLILTQVGSSYPNLYPATYVLKTLAAAVLLAAFWRHYTKIRWDYWWLGLIFGVLGVVQWVGMEKLLLTFWPNYPRLSADPFVPTDYFKDYPAWLLWGFVAVRWAGAALVVPVMEELFWRDFAWRSVLAPNDFKLAGIGEWDPKAFFGIALIFSAVHIQWMTAIVWGLMIAGLLVYTRSLGAAIIMHGVTNFLLGAYVLYTKEWYFW